MASPPTQRHEKAATVYFPSAYAGVVQQLYVAYFGRPADSAGLGNFEEALSQADAPPDIASLVQAYNTNAQVRALIDGFGNSKESAALYGTGTTSQFVSAVFQNILNRSPTQAGLDFWVGAIDNGSLTQGAAALAIMAGALGNGSAQGVQDAQLVDNKILVAAAFTAALTTSVDVAAYAGPSAASSARAMLAGVSSTTDPTSYGGQIQTLLQNLLVSAPSYDLGGTVSGLEPGTSLVLSIGSTMLTVSDNGSISFGAVPNGTQYTVVVQQPYGQLCILSNASGAIASAPVSNLAVSCHLGFNQPGGVAVDAVGNVYVADTGNNLIRKISAEGIITTLAGTAKVCGSQDGVGTQASFCLPEALAVDAAGNVYVADCKNHVIRKIDPAGVVTTFAGTAGVAGGADGTGPAASFSSPYGIAIDAAGNLYVSDITVETVRKITPSGVVTTLAGTPFQDGHSDGVEGVSSFDFMQGLTIDAAGNIYVADFANNYVRKVSPAGYTTTLGGTFIDPSSVAVDGAGNLYIDNGNSTVLKMDPTGNLSQVAGSGHPGNSDGYLGSFSSLSSIAVDTKGNIYIADTGNNSIRKVAPGGYMSTLAGTATSTATFADTSTETLPARPGGHDK